VSYNQSVVEIHGRSLAVMLDTRYEIFTKVIQPETVFVRVNLLEQVVSQLYQLLLSNRTLEYRKLNALSVVQTNASHAP